MFFCFIILCYSNILCQTIRTTDGCNYRIDYILTPLAPMIDIVAGEEVFVYDEDVDSLVKQDLEMEEEFLFELDSIKILKKKLQGILIYSCGKGECILPPNLWDSITEKDKKLALNIKKAFCDYGIQQDSIVQILGVNRLWKKWRKYIPSWGKHQDGTNIKVETDIVIVVVYEKENIYNLAIIEKMRKIK